jgi:DNA replication and repair protein RecF
MFLRSLYLRNFRIYKEALFEFSPHLNVICGANALGKTTILEAIYYLISGHSFRTSQNFDLIRQGAEGFFIEAFFIKRGVEQRLKVLFDGKERKIIYNNTCCPSTSSLLGLIQGVLITPEDVALVKGEPQIRRLFLDLQIAQTDPLYVHHLTRYNRAMRQRNYLLKARSIAAIESWEHEMANAAAYVSQQRFSSISHLQISSQHLHNRLSGEINNFELHYKSGAPRDGGPDVLKYYHREQYHKHRKREMELGITLHGPHKDDLLIAIGSKSVRYFASQGQQRGCVAVLKLAEWMRLHELSETKPLMLIDDVGLSLDQERKSKLFAYVGGMGQVFLTATEDLPIESSQGEKKVIRPQKEV